MRRQNGDFRELLHSALKEEILGGRKIVQKARELQNAVAPIMEAHVTIQPRKFCEVGR